MILKDLTKVPQKLRYVLSSSNFTLRGVVDFFNAIEKHQNELKRKLEQAGPTELRRSKVIKSTKEKDITEKITEQQVFEQKYYFFIRGKNEVK